MKKLFICLAILTLATFWACSSDDGSCIVCTYSQEGNNDNIDVCNKNGNAISDGYDTDTTYSAYIDSLENSGYICQ
ncbi:hypothetical protein [Flavobacterium rhizosphaerae]|uniref:Lipoprotein n=1 Tax=Flavobacterium rhizosphaerae TaxID=3163298 RepID=A0ABW8Z2V7_9FLAO